MPKEIGTTTVLRFGLNYESLRLSSRSGVYLNVRRRIRFGFSCLVLGRRFGRSFRCRQFSFVRPQHGCRVFQVHRRGSRWPTFGRNGSGVITPYVIGRHLRKSDNTNVARALTDREWTRIFGTSSVGDPLRFFVALRFEDELLRYSFRFRQTEGCTGRDSGDAVSLFGIVLIGWAVGRFLFRP